ncbi:hypothetical protein DXG01_012406 [Tephrocybe rancida]|nr:hypothetical protein DXG01_012406 [Tephrocybe rancida]
MRIPSIFFSFSRQANFTPSLLASVSTLSVVVVLLATIALCSHPSARPAKAVSFPALLPAPSPTSLSTRVLFPSTPRPKFARERPVGFQVGIYVLEMVAYIGAAVVFAFIEPKKTPEVRPSIHGSGSTEGDDWFLDEDDEEDDDEDDDEDEDKDFPMDMRVAFLIALIALKEIADNNRRRALIPPPTMQLSVTVPAVIVSVGMEVEEKVEVVEVEEEVEIVEEVEVVEEDGEVESAQVEDVVEAEEKVVEVKEAEVTGKGEEFIKLEKEGVKVVVEKAVEDKVEVEVEDGGEWQVVERRGHKPGSVAVLAPVPVPSPDLEQTEVRPCGTARAVADIVVTIEEASDAVLSAEPQGTAVAPSDTLAASEEARGNTVEPALDGGGSSVVEEEDIVGVESEEMVKFQMSTTCLGWSDDVDLEMEGDVNIGNSSTLVVSSTMAPIVDAASLSSLEAAKSSSLETPLPPADMPSSLMKEDGGGWETISRRGKKTRPVSEVAPMSAPLAMPDYSAVMKAREERDKVNRAIWQARQDEKAAAERAEAAERARREEEKRRHKEEMRRREEEKKRQLSEATARVKRALEAARMEMQLAATKVPSPPAAAHEDTTPNWAEEVAMDNRAKLQSELVSVAPSSLYFRSDRVEPIAKSVEKVVENVGEGPTDQAEMNEDLNDIPESESPFPSDSNPHPCEATPVDNADRLVVELEEVVLRVEENESSPEPLFLASSECEAIRPVESSNLMALPINETEEEAPEERVAERTGGEQAPLELSAIQIEETPDEEDIVERTGGDRAPLERSANDASCEEAGEIEDVGVGELDISDCIDTEILPEETVKFDNGRDHAILSSPEPPSTTEIEGGFEAPFDVLLEQSVHDASCEEVGEIEDTGVGKVDVPKGIKPKILCEDTVEDNEGKYNEMPFSPKPPSPSKVEAFKASLLDVLDSSEVEASSAVGVETLDKGKEKEIAPPKPSAVRFNDHEPIPNWADEVTTDMAKERETGSSASAFSTSSSIAVEVTPEEVPPPQMSGPRQTHRGNPSVARIKAKNASRSQRRARATERRMAAEAENGEGAGPSSDIGQE